MSSTSIVASKTYMFCIPVSKTILSNYILFKIWKPGRQKQKIQNFLVDPQIYFSFPMAKMRGAEMSGS